MGVGITQFLEEVEVKEQSQSECKEEAERLTKSSSQMSSRKEEQEVDAEERSVASESRESKTRCERVRERGTFREKKPPILFEMVTASEEDTPSQRAEEEESEHSRGLRFREALLNRQVVVSVCFVFAALLQIEVSLLDDVMSARSEVNGNRVV